MAELKADVHPPLYYQILHFWIRLFGTGERAVRSLSGLAYLLSVYALYRLGNDLYGYKTALLIAAIYLSSPLAILSAQFARMYSLLSLLSVLSTWLYVKFLLKSRASKSIIAAYVVINILGTFTHIAFFFVLFGQIVFHFLIHNRNRLRSFAFAIVLSLLPYIFFWAPVLLGQITQTQEGLAWISRPTFSMLGELFVLYGGVFWLLVPVFLYLWWRGGLLSWQPSNLLRMITPPFWFLAITILTPLLISLFKPIFNARLAIVGLHLFALTIGAMIGSRTNYFFLLELILLTAVGVVVLHPGVSSCDNRAMAAYLSKTTNNGDVVIFTSLTRLPIDYYLERVATTKKLFETSFPAEIDKHPGYEGRITDPSRREALELESRELVDKIAEMPSRGPGQRIFVFRGLHPQIDSIVEESLRGHFELRPAEGVQCGELSPYFKEVVVYRQK